MPTKNEIKATLDDLGISYPTTARKAELEALLPSGGVTFHSEYPSLLVYRDGVAAARFQDGRYTTNDPALIKHLDDVPEARRE